MNLRRYLTPHQSAAITFVAITSFFAFNHAYYPLLFRHRGFSPWQQSMLGNMVGLAAIVASVVVVLRQLPTVLMFRIALAS